MAKSIKTKKSALWSIRMRASKEERGKGLGARGQNTRCRKQSEVSSKMPIHISGAEGLYELSETDRVIKNYYLRAMNHPRGMPDKVIITVERIKQNPIMISLLPVSTIQCDSPYKARRVINRLLSEAGVSKKAIQNGIRVVAGNVSMRGASLMSSESGVRIEPDRNRGVRVSRLGIERATEKTLSRRLTRDGINTRIVKEALVLASKAASCRGVVAELCVSDDPDYTTGYVASKRFGYVRILNIKNKGSMAGGRVFFIEEKADIGHIVDYLEKTPVLA